MVIILLKGGNRKLTCVSGNEAENDGVLDDALSVPLFVCFPLVVLFFGSVFSVRIL